MAATSSAPVDMRVLLSEFRTKVKSEELETLHERFDIPPAFELALPEEDSAAYEHGGDKARLVAEEKAHSDQLALQVLKVELEESKAAHQAALAKVQSVEARLNFVTSEEGKKETIQAYRLGPIGKAELTLAVKAGFDYLKAQLPHGVEPPSGLVYPPLIESSLPMLLELEKKGAGVRLDSNKSEDDEEDDKEEDEDGGSDGDGST